MKKLIITVLLISLACLMYAWEDEVLIRQGAMTTFLKPNIMMLLDVSGSMNMIIYPNFFDKSTAYTDISGDLIFTGGVIRYYRPQFSDSIWKLSYRTDIAGPYGKFGENIGAGAWVYYAYNLTQVTADVWQLDVGNGCNPIYLFVQTYNGQEVRYDGDLLNFLLYHATDHQRTIWNHFMIYGNWDAWDGDPDITEANGVYSPAQDWCC